MPITHPDTAPASANPSGAPISTDAWNADHSVPTLAEVLVAGNDPDGTFIEAAGFGGGFPWGGLFDLTPGLVDQGGQAELFGGDFDGSFYGGGIHADGATDGAHGKLKAWSGPSGFGNPGDTLQSDGTYATWQAVVTTAAASPVGGGFVSVLVADTTNKKLYGWTGSDYTQIGAWT